MRMLMEVWLGMAMFVLMNVAVLLTASIVVSRYLPGVQFSLRLASVLTLYMLLVTVYLMLPGLLGSLTSLSVLVVSVGGLIIAAALWGSEFLARLRGDFQRSLSLPLNSSMTLTLVIGAIVLVTKSLKATLFVPHNPDSLMYHIPFIYEWIQAGSVWQTFNGGLVSHASLSPAAGELFGLWLVLPFGNDFLLGFQNFLPAIAGSVGLYALSAQLGADLRWGLLSALLFLTSPVMAGAYTQVQLGTQLSDLTLAAAFLLVLTHGIGWIRTGKPLFLLLSLGAGGLLVGSKLSGLAYLGLAALFLLAYVWIHGMPRRFDRGTGVTVLAGIVMFFFAGGFWYLRNYLLVGNPLFPARVSVMGAILWPGFEFGNSLLHGLAEGRVFFGDLLSAHVRRGEGLLFILLLLTGILTFLHGRARRGGTPLSVGRSRDRLGMIGGMVGAVGLYLITPFQANYLESAQRFALPALAIAGVLWAVLASGLGASRQRLVLWAAILALAFNLWISLAGESRRLILISVSLSLALMVLVQLYRKARQSGVRTRHGRPLWTGAIVAVLVLVLTLPAVAFQEREDRRYEGAWWGNMMRYLERQTGGWPLKVAYVGFHEVAPLYGRQILNTVIYINIDAKSDFHYMDYMRECLSPPQCESYAYHRSRPNETAWLQNVRAAGLDYLLVAPWGGGDPSQLERFVESSWVERHPQILKLAYVDPDNQARRVYLLVPKG